MCIIPNIEFVSPTLTGHFSSSINGCPPTCYVQIAFTCSCQMRILLDRSLSQIAFGGGFFLMFGDCRRHFSILFGERHRSRMDCVFAWQSDIFWRMQQKDGEREMWWIRSKRRERGNEGRKTFPCQHFFASYSSSSGGRDDETRQKEKAAGQNKEGKWLETYWYWFKLIPLRKGACTTCVLSTVSKVVYETMITRLCMLNVKILCYIGLYGH